MQPKAYWAKDSDFCGRWAVEETSVPMMKKNSYFKMNQKSFSQSKRLKKSLSATRYSWIPPINLTPSVADFKENKLDKFSLKFDYGDKDCLSSSQLQK